MKTCILKKWYVNIILFLIFGLSFMFFTNKYQENFLICSSDITKVEICKTHLEKTFLDKIIPKNDTEKIDTLIVSYKGSAIYNFFEKYGKFLGFGIGFFAMIIIFLIYGLKFMLGLGKVKALNVVGLIIGYCLVFVLGLNFLYWEPRFSEIGVISIQFLGHTLTLISFYFIVIMLSMVILKGIINLFSNKKQLGKK